MSETLDLTSNDPAVLNRMADEAIAHMKGEVAAFDAKMTPHYQRLLEYEKAAAADGSLSRAGQYAERISRYRADWHEARQPYLREIQRIAMARDVITPQMMTFSWAEGVFTDVKDLPA
jgi:hypothetical protein